MIRSTHYHITQHGLRSAPIKNKGVADLKCRQLAGQRGTPSGFLPMVVPCYSSACLDPPPVAIAHRPGRLR
jgi:hypothetical protein